jgi:hypothetical protein
VPLTGVPEASLPLPPQADSTNEHSSALAEVARFRCWRGMPIVKFLLS